MNTLSSSGHHAQYDPRDRTQEFFHTVSTFEKQLILTSGGGAVGGSVSSVATSNGQQQLRANGSHRPLPSRLFQSSPTSSSSSSNFVANDFESSDDVHSSLLLSGSAHASAHHHSASLSTSYSSPSSTSQQPRHQHSQFTLAAKEISQQLVILSEKLEKLGHLAKQRSLFNDPAEEFNDLTAVIKSDLQNLDREIAVLHQSSQSSQDEQDESTGERRKKTAHGMHHNNFIVKNLSTQLLNATKTFHHALEVRTKNLKDQNSRRREFETSSVQLLKRRNNPFDSVVAAATSSSSSSSSTGGVIDLEPHTADDVEHPHHQHAHHSQLQQQQQQQQQLADPHVVDEYYSSRVGAVENIESTIHELGGMYKRLVELVQQQGEVAVRIDANLDDTLVNVEAGHNQLLKYYDRMSGNTMLILKVFAILIAFLVFFMIFVA